MANNKKIYIIIFACAVVFSFAFSINSIANREENFRAQLVEIYREYDNDLTENGEFSLRRLMISDYNKKETYGARAYAFDKKHNFAVLQYETEEQARKAYNQIKKDGYAVDADSRAVLTSSNKGLVYPEASNALGTPSYISNFEMGKDDVVVAVIDTGVMYDHELMADRFVSRGYDFSDDGRNNAYYDTNMAGSYYGHGTFVCGIIADNTPDNVKILPYKAVAFGDSDASNSAIVAAIYDAVDKGASVISISLSTTSGASAFKYAVNTAVSKGVCVCASAGNDGKEIKYRYPATISGVITVSSIESDFKTFASFSNYGKAIDFCAPGRKIVSACPYRSGEEKFSTNSGTSFSAPYIAAVCADVKSLNNEFSKDEVYNIICDFSKDLGSSGYDVYFGNGLPDLSNMLYTDGETYSFSIPQGTLEIFKSADYTQETQPWKLFANRLLSVKVNDGVEKIGNYAFYNMPLASFEMAETYNDIGEYAFNGCKKLSSFAFTTEVNSIGEGAFANIDNFVISGYQNTAAEAYAQRENITFNVLGCKHNYVAKIIDPTEDEAGYTIYTCTVCKDTYKGEYIEPPEYYSGECGMGVSWKYITKTKALEISGSGYMYSYSSEKSVPWSSFMGKIKSVSIGKDVVYLSDYILYNASNAEELKIYSKKLLLRDNIIVFSPDAEAKLAVYAYEDSYARDYFTKNNIEYISLGCGHSRYVAYYEERPSCCFDTTGIYTCMDCMERYEEYISNENKGHYLSGTVETIEKDAVNNAEIYIDSKLSAKTNEKGKYVVYPVLCGEHKIEIKKNNVILESFRVNINRSNMRCNAEICYGDFVSNGYINAKDYSYALKNGFDDLEIMNFGKVKKSIILNEKYEAQELPFALRVYNEPNDDSSYMRDFVAVIENNSEFEIKESGFIYGKNMSEDMLYLENVGKANSEGLIVRMRSSTDNYKYEKVLTYGSSSSTGVVSARFFIIYTNGVTDYTYYSEVTSHSYS